MPHQIIPLVGILSVFGMPTVLAALHLRQRHREKMRALESANNQKVAELEAARNDLEARVRTLETIVTEGDRNLEQRLRQLASAATPALDGERRQLPSR
jgi:cell division protein FtsB